MRAFLRVALSLGLVASFSTSAAVAEPTKNTDISQPSVVALDGPDRRARQRERAVESPPPMRRPATRRQMPAPRPAPARTSTFKYEKMDCKTLTDVPFDINWTGDCTWDRPVHDIYVFDGGNIDMWTSTDTYRPNRRGAMGADQEYMRLALSSRLGVWANGRLENQAPRSIVNKMVRRMKGITCGTWTSAEAVNIAGIPAYKATGTDVFGNYWYEVYALKRWGQTYAFAVRTDYTNRWNTQLHDEIAYMVTHIHPTSWTE